MRDLFILNTSFQSAVELVVAILQKGMPPLKKVALLQYINDKLNMDQLTKVNEVWIFKISRKKFEPAIK